ncbi:response regulator [Cytobacillus pseudoceanisediminis]|uniref:response regulator n=2 Tax=Cytobacillus pseudoceanisediminis TaxID=3051614 RepID=UPI00365A5DF3
MTNPSIGVLIVEDDPVASSVYEQLIQNGKDFTVIGKAQTASETIQLLNVITPDLILLDVHLPDANGIDLLFQIKHAHRHVDIIMITASNDAKTVRDAMRGGAYSYLLKPIMVDSFFSTFEEYSQTRHARQTNAHIKQDEIQRLFQKNTPAAETKHEAENLPKGIDKHTLRKVTQAMKAASTSLNAEEVGLQIGASHSTARRYLEYLVSINLVEVDIVYGSVGRPERRYKQP